MRMADNAHLPHLPLLSRTPQALLDAIATMTLPADAQRLFHGRGGMSTLVASPGRWTGIPPVLLLTSYQPVSDDELAPIQAALAARWAELMPDQPMNLVFQHRDEVRADTRVLSGTCARPACGQ